MNIKVSTTCDKAVLENLYQFYQHDLAVYTGKQLNASGLFDKSQYIDLYWSEANRYPLLCMNDEKPCGFALIKETGPGHWSLDEFFIARPFRRCGLGYTFACAIFDTYRGEWEVCQMDENIPAIEFWRSSIQKYAAGDFTESRSLAQPTGPMQVFKSR